MTIYPGVVLRAHTRVSIAVGLTGGAVQARISEARIVLGTCVSGVARLTNAHIGNARARLTRGAVQARISKAGIILNKNQMLDLLV